MTQVWGLRVFAFHLISLKISRIAGQSVQTPIARTWQKLSACLEEATDLWKAYHNEFTEAKPSWSSSLENAKDVYGRLDWYACDVRDDQRMTRPCYGLRKRFVAARPYAFVVGEAQVKLKDC